MSNDDKRQRYKAYWREWQRLQAERERLKERHDTASFEHWRKFRRWLPQPTLPSTPPYPDDLRGLQCGAKTKAGTPCKLTSLYSSGRCKWHGGLSTGPKTAAGKAQMRINGMKGGRPRKQAKP